MCDSVSTPPWTLGVDRHKRKAKLAKFGLPRSASGRVDDEPSVTTEALFLLRSERPSGPPTGYSGQIERHEARLA